MVKLPWWEEKTRWFSGKDYLLSWEKSLVGSWRMAPVIWPLHSQEALLPPHVVSGLYLVTQFLWGDKRQCGISFSYLLTLSPTMSRVVPVSPHGKELELKSRSSMMLSGWDDCKSPNPTLDSVQRFKRFCVRKTQLNHSQIPDPRNFLANKCYFKSVSVRLICVCVCAEQIIPIKPNLWAKWVWCPKVRCEWWKQEVKKIILPANCTKNTGRRGA